MAVVNKIIHRFVQRRDIYMDPTKELYNQIIPYNTQAYSYELKENGDPTKPDDYIVRYVLGTGRSTYHEIAEGQGRSLEGNFIPELSKEFVLNSNTQLIDIVTKLIESQVIVSSYITCDAAGNPFVTKAALDNAETWYDNGESVLPKKNDYVIITADETHPTGTGDPQTTRYVCSGIDNQGKPIWEYQYIINNGNFTPEQQAALNSGITAEKVEQYDSYADEIASLLDHLTDYNNPHRVTAEQIGLGNVDNTSDLDKPISTATQEALDSITEGITEHIENEDIHVTAADKVTWSNKQDTLKMGSHIKIANNTISVEDNLASYDNSISQFVNKSTDELENYYTKDELSGIYRYLGEVETKEDLPSGNIYVPDNYTELTYLTADQLEYIDTHYHPNQKTRIILKFSINGEGNNYLYGTDIDHEINKVAFGINYGATTAKAFFGDKVISFDIDNQVHTLIQRKNGVYLDSEQIEPYSDIDDFTTLSTLWLFRSQTADTHPQNISIYDFAIYEGDLLVKHYVPVERDADNALGMYECVNEEFKQNEYNPEEFNFTAGPYAGYGNEEGAVYKVIDEDAFYMWHDNEWVEITRFYKAGVGIEIAQDSTINNTFDVLVDGESVVENAVATIDLTGKVDKTSEASKVYGTDENGNQTTYDAEAFGKIDDVQLNGVSVVENKVANIEPEAADIAYTNEQYPAMQTLQDAMDKLLYITPSVTLKAENTASNIYYEMGTTKTSTALTWTWNKNIRTQSLNQSIGSLDPALRSYTYTTSYNTDKTFTITGSDGTTTKTSSVNVKFIPKRYWGVSTETSLTDAQIIALSNELSTSRTQTRTFNCSGGKYFYFVIRTSYCSGIAFKVGGLAFSDMDVTTRNVVNAQGYSASYNIYRVHNIQTGLAISVEVL